MGDPTELIGSWSFERTIEDFATGEKSSAEGTCQIAPESDTSIRWQERGQLRHRGMTFPAARLLRFSNEGDGWQVRFSDGRLFHPWRPGETAIHPCGLDLYEGTFDIDRSHGPVTAWRITWKVRGPHKNLLIRTRLIRQQCPQNG